MASLWVLPVILAGSAGGDFGGVRAWDTKWSRSSAVLMWSIIVMSTQVVSDLVMKWMEDLSFLFLFWSFTKGLYWYKSVDSFRIYTPKTGGRVWLAAFVFPATWLLDVLLVIESWKQMEWAWPPNSFTSGLFICTMFSLSWKESGGEMFLAWLWH